MRGIRGDFVYFDPPYAPLTRTALFTSYTAAGFSLEDQARLQQVVIELAARGCWVLLSNSTAPDITRLYKGDPQAVAAGLRTHKAARRAINSAAKREVLEYLITKSHAERASRLLKKSVEWDRQTIPAYYQLDIAGATMRGVNS